MSLSSIELAAFTVSYYVLGVCDHCGPVETLSESLSNSRSQTSVVATGADMYFS
jgi:hypothetical protein